MEHMEFIIYMFTIIYVKFTERTRRMTVRGEEGNGGENKRDEEEWPLKDVVFVEDVKNVPLGNFIISHIVWRDIYYYYSSIDRYFTHFDFLGRVLKVDGAYAAVRFPITKDPKDIASAIAALVTGSSSNKDSAPGQNIIPQADDCVALLQDCRLMRKDELQVVKWNTSNKSPDCFQKTPRKLSVPADVTILSLAVSIF